jgi:hypothetical protein
MFFLFLKKNKRKALKKNNVEVLKKYDFFAFFQGSGEDWYRKDDKVLEINSETYVIFKTFAMNNKYPIQLYKMLPSKVLQLKIKSFI